MADYPECLAAQVDGHPFVPDHLVFHGGPLDGHTTNVECGPGELYWCGRHAYRLDGWVYRLVEGGVSRREAAA